LSFLSNRDLKYLWVYLLFFNLIWFLYELSFGQLFRSDFPILSAVTKVIVWICPVLGYLRFVNGLNPFVYLKINRNGLRSIRLLIIVCITMGVCFWIKVNYFGAGSFNFGLGLHKWLNVVLLAGLTEEIVFRGFILQKMKDYMNFHKANVLTALLFVSIHFGIWHANGLTASHFLSSAIQVYFIGLVLGYLFKRSDSLWTVIIVHSAYNMGILISG
jgi:uncharacterized protein